MKQLCFYIFDVLFGTFLVFLDLGIQLFNLVFQVIVVVEIVRVVVVVGCVSRQNGGLGLACLFYWLLWLLLWWLVKIGFDR